MSDADTIADLSLDHDIPRLLFEAVKVSGKTRQCIASEARIHRDALRRILDGKRDVSLDEALRILSACGARPHAALVLQLIGEGNRAIAWMDTDLGAFLETFLRELPQALERSLGNQLHEVRPRWAKGAAHRVARLLSDHIDELARRDALYIEPV